MPPTFTDDGQTVQHPLELKFNATGWDILCAIEQGFRAQVDVKGKLAEWFLYKQLKELKSRGVIEDVIWHDTNGRPDFDIMIGGRTIRMECKNVRSGANPKGSQRDFRVEIQKTRNQLVGGRELTGLSGRRFRGAGCLPLQPDRDLGLCLRRVRSPRAETELSGLFGDHAAGTT